MAMTNWPVPIPPEIKEGAKKAVGEWLDKHPEFIPDYGPSKPPVAYRAFVCLLAGAILASLIPINMELPHWGTLAWGPLWVALVLVLDCTSALVIDWVWE